MALSQRVNVRLGSLIETVSGGLCTASGDVSFIKRDKGFELYSPSKNACGVTLPNYGAFNTNTWSIVIAYRGTYKSDSIIYGILSTGTATTGFSLYNYNSNTSIFYNGIFLSGFTTSLKGLNHYCITYNGTTLLFYANGSLIYSNNISIPASTTNTVLGGYQNTANLRSSYIASYESYSHVLSEREIAAAYKDFLNSYPIQKEKYPNVVNKPLDLSREKENTVGISILNGWNFNDGNWTTSNATIVDQNTFTTSGSNGYIRTTSHTLVQGTKYNLRLKLTVSNGIVFRIYDYNATSIQYTTTGTGSSVEINTTFTATTVSGTGIRLLLASSGQCDIDYMFIEPVTGLVAAYNFIPQGNTLVDISGNGNNGVITGATSNKNGMIFNAKTNNINVDVLKNYVSGNITVLFRAKAVGASGSGVGRILDTGRCLVYRNDLNNNLVTSRDGVGAASTALNSWPLNQYITGAVTSTSTAVCNLYIDGVLNGTANQDIADPMTSSTAHIGNNSTFIRGFNGEIVDLRVYNRILTLTEIKAYHNQFVAPTLTETFEDCAADNIPF